MEIKIPSLTITPQQIEETLVRDDQTNEIWSESSTVLDCSPEKEKRNAVWGSCFPEWPNYRCSNGLRSVFQCDRLIELVRIKQKAPANIFNINDHLRFWIQVANGQLEKPLATATIKFDIGDNTFAELSVHTKKLAVKINDLHFKLHNSVVTDSTHGIIHFPYSIMQVKSTASETTAKPQSILTGDTLKQLTMTTKTTTIFVHYRFIWTQQ